MTEERVARLRVAGVIEGEAGRARLVDRVLGGAVSGGVRYRPEVNLVTAGGERLRLDTKDAQLVTEETVERGPWSEVSPELRELVATAPPPFAVVEMTNREIRAGDLVELFGEVLETAIDAASYRETPESRPSRVRALLIAAGPDHTAELDKAIRREYPPVKRPGPLDPGLRDPDSDRYRWPAGAFVQPVLFTLALAALVLIKRSWIPGWPIAHFTSAITFTLGLLVSAWPIHDVPMFHQATYERVMRSALLAGARNAILGGVVIGFELVFVSIWLMPLLAALALAILALATWTPRLDLAYARTLSGTPPDGWTRIEGTVADSTPVTLGGKLLAFGLSSKAFENQGTFQITTATGVVEVDPVHTMWASSVVIGSEDERSLVVPVGAKVVAVGRIRDGRLESVGTQPALLFATGPTGAPLTVLQRAVRARIVLVVLELVLLGIAIAAVVI